MNFEKFAQNLLGLENRIVFVGIVDSSSTLLYSLFRDGAKLHEDYKGIQKFMAISPQLTMDELEKEKPSLGQISMVLVRFAKRVFLLSRFNEFVIVVGLDIEIPTPLPERIAGLIKSAARRAPDLPLRLQTVEVVPSFEES